MYVDISYPEAQENSTYLIRAYGHCHGSNQERIQSVSKIINFVSPCTPLLLSRNEFKEKELLADARNWMNLCERQHGSAQNKFF